MNDDKYEVLGGGVHQLNKRCNSLPLDLQLFALTYNKVDNPYEFSLIKPTWAKGDIKEPYNLENYYKKIANYDTITTLPEENLNYIKEALPNVISTAWMLGNIKDIDTGEPSGCSQISSIGDLGTLDTNISTNADYLDFSRIENCEGTFANCTNLGRQVTESQFNYKNNRNHPGIVAFFEFGNNFKPTNTSYMFYNCFNKTISISVSNGIYFFGDAAIMIIDISMDTSLVKDMSCMFYNSFNFLIETPSSSPSVALALNKVLFNCKTFNCIFDMKSCTNYKKMFSRPTYAFLNNSDKKHNLNYAGIQIKNPPQLYYDDKTAFETEIGLKDGEYEIVS